jgi:hypothetical protein
MKFKKSVDVVKRVGTSGNNGNTLYLSPSPDHITTGTQWEQSGNSRSACFYLLISVPGPVPTGKTERVGTARSFTRAERRPFVPVFPLFPRKNKSRAFSNGVLHVFEGKSDKTLGRAIAGSDGGQGPRCEAPLEAQ